MVVNEKRLFKVVFHKRAEKCMIALALVCAVDHFVKNSFV